MSFRYTIETENPIVTDGNKMFNCKDGKLRLKIVEANPWHTGTPTEREWVLGIFREADTGWINPIPFVCEYLQGLKTKATTEEGWIIRDCTDIDQPCDYYRKLQCIAWQKIEPYKEAVKRLGIR